MERTVRQLWQTTLRTQRTRQSGAKERAVARHLTSGARYAEMEATLFRDRKGRTALVEHRIQLGRDGPSLMWFTVLRKLFSLHRRNGPAQRRRVKGWCERKSNDRLAPHESPVYNAETGRLGLRLDRKVAFRTWAANSDSR